MPALYLHQNNNNHNIATSKSFASLFRSYTQTSFSPSDGNEDSLTKRIPGLPMDPAENTTFNFDVGNIEYNPSTKDMDAVEMHHILNDDMFKPVKRVISTLILYLYSLGTSSMPSELQTRYGYK